MEKHMCRRRGYKFAAGGGHDVFAFSGAMRDGASYKSRRRRRRVATARCASNVVAADHLGDLELGGGQLSFAVVIRRHFRSTKNCRAAEIYGAETVGAASPQSAPASERASSAALETALISLRVARPGHSDDNMYVKCLRLPYDF